MAKSGPFMNAESSDEDSVRSNTTTESDEEDAYNVDKILYERKGRDGRPEYLLLWEGYPLHLASFEPKEHLTSDILLVRWAEEKALIAEGKAKVFNIQEWEDAWEQARVDREDRARRRKAKRRRRGVPVSSSEDEHSELHATDIPTRKRSTRCAIEVGESESDDDALPSKTTKVSPAKKVFQKRKGVATKIRRSRSVVIDDSSDDDGNDLSPPGSDMDSLFEGSLPDSQPASRPRKSPNTTVATSSKTPELNTKRPLLGKQSNDVKTAKSAKSTTAVPTPTKIGPTATAQRSKGPFTANWDKPKKSCVRQSVSSNATMDSTESKIRTLQGQNRLQKYRRNEQAPDLNALTMVDPKTGKTAPLNPAPTQVITDVRPPTGLNSKSGTAAWSTPKARAPVAVMNTTPHASVDTKNTLPTAMTEASDAYRRKSPQQERHRSLTSDTPKNISRQLSDRLEYTCAYWLRGFCKYSSEDCKFAHKDTGHYLPAHEQRRAVNNNTAEITCAYWLEGGCHRSAENCEFAHRDTGVYSRRTLERRRKGTVKSLAEVDTTSGNSATSSSFAPAATGANAQIASQNKLTVTNRDATNDDQSSITSSIAGLPGSSVVAQPALDTARALPRVTANQLTKDPRLRNRASALTYRASLHVQISESRVIINAGLQNIDPPEFNELVPPDAPDGIANAPNIVIQKVIALKELARCPDMFRAEAVCGNIAPSDSDSFVNAKAVADLCGKCGMVYFVAFEMFTMLIYPSASHDFRFLDRAGSSSNTTEQASLRFKIGPALASLSKHLPTVFAMSQSDPCDAAQQDELERVLRETDPKWLVPEKEHKSGIRGVIVIMPDEHVTEMSLLEQYYKKNGCEVVRYPEDWEWFKENFKGPGMVIVHRETELCKIRGLFRVTDRQGSTILRFGVQMIYDEMHLSSRNAVYSYERLFTMGRATFITDDVFIYAPRTATDIINTFLDKTKPKPVGGESGKIITRPSIKAWLQTLATNNNPQLVAHRDEYVMLYQAICELCPPEHESRYEENGSITSFPNHKSHLISKDALDDEWWWMPGLWERDPTLHTDKMVEWFAGFSAGPLATKFRRMVIVHEPKEGRGVMKDGRSVYEKERDPRGWARKYQHLAVLRPKEWLDTHK